MKAVSNLLSYVFVWIFYTLCRALPFKAASALGGGLGWFIATLPASFNLTARQNLKKVFPELTAAKVRRLQQSSVVHFGRTMAEFPKVYRMNKTTLEHYVKATGLEHATDNAPILLMTGHIGNWDILGMYMASIGVPCASVYRAANNTFVDKLMVATRALSGATQIPKGAHGARLILKEIAKNNSVGMLIDQKMNDGIESTFFGHSAMTAPALAELALKKNIPVVPAFCWREDDGTFTLEVRPPLNLIRSGNHKQDVADNTLMFNKVLEEAIRRKPAQWTWFHRRFPKD